MRSIRKGTLSTGDTFQGASENTSQPNTRLNTFSFVGSREIESTHQERMRRGCLCISRCVDRIWLLCQCWKSPDVSVAEIHHYLSEHLTIEPGTRMRRAPDGSRATNFGGKPVSDGTFIWTSRGMVDCDDLKKPSGNWVTGAAITHFSEAGVAILLALLSIQTQTPDSVPHADGGTETRNSSGNASIRYL